MSNITLITAVFPPEPIVSAKTSCSLANGLVQRNHSVRVITNFPNRPEGKLYKGFKRSFYSSETDPAGFRRTRCYSFFSKESSMFSRWMENISFGFTSSIALLLSKRPDVVYSNSWPIFATGLVCLVCKLRQIPLVISVQDMYPESLAIQGRIKPGQWLYRFLLSIDNWIAKNAARIIVLSQSHSQRYAQARQVDPSKIKIAANWIDQNSVLPMDKNTYRNEVGISSTAFVLVYGGNIGKAAGVDTLIEGMRKLNTRKEVVLIIAGSGSELQNCQNLAANIENVQIFFHTPWDAEQTSKILAAADVLVLPTRGNQSLISVPSKLLSYLLSARPVIAMVMPESDTAQVIKEAGCGWVIPPDNVSLVAEKVKVVANTPAKILDEMGISGRKYTLKNYTTSNSLPKIIQIIENVIKIDMSIY